MPYRRIEAPVEKEEAPKGFRRIEKPRSKPGIAKRIAANVPKEFFAEAVGGVPQIADIAAKTTPALEQIEEMERPSYLSSTGLEPAPEHGLRNLLTLIGQSDLAQKLTPEALRERFRTQTEGEFEPQSFLEKILARGGALGGQTAGLGGGLRSILMQGLGGLVGQTGRELGLNEPLAAGAEIATSLGTDLAAKSLKKGLTPKKGEEQLVQFAKEKGLTEKEITPLLKSSKSQEKLGSLALKTGELKKTVKEIGRKFDENFFEPLKESASKAPKLNEGQVNDFFDGLIPIQKELSHSKLPTSDKEYAKEQLVKLAQKVAEEGLSPRDIIDTWQDIKKNIQWKKAGSKPAYDLIKHLEDTLVKVNPSLGEEALLTNKLYSKYIPFKNALEPSVMDNVLALGQDGELALALAFHNPTLIKHALGTLGGKYVANQLLTNPKYHNFSTKMLNAARKQDKDAIRRLANQFKQMVDRDMEKESTSSKQK